MTTKFLNRLVSIAACAMALMGASAAHATLANNQGFYTVTVGTPNYSTAPIVSFTGDLSTTFNTPLSIAKTNFFTINPQNCGTSCQSNGAIITDTITVDITIKDATGGTNINPLVITGLFTANYNATNVYGGYNASGLACSLTPKGDQSDCFDWAGAGTTPTGSVTDDLTLSDGTIAAITFYNAQDWSITPMIAITTVPGGGEQVPEPSSLALFSAALIGFGAIRWRFRKATKDPMTSSTPA